MTVSFVLTIDQRGSRHAPDRVEGLLARLREGPWKTTLPFQRTIGDECQGAVLEPLAVLDIALMLLREGHWSIGIGIGGVTPARSGRTAEADGPGFHAARAAVEAAKGAQPPLELRSAPQTSLAADADALLRLLARANASRTPTQWAVVEAVREEQGDGAYRTPRGTQKAAAQRLGVTPQAVSKAYRGSNWDEEYAARLALAHLLGRLHEELGGAT